MVVTDGGFSSYALSWVLNGCDDAYWYALGSWMSNLPVCG